MCSSDLNKREERGKKGEREEARQRERERERERWREFISRVTFLTDGRGMEGYRRM